VYEIKNRSQIFFDAREYFPKHFEDRLLWKIAYQGLNRHLVYKYMSRCDFISTVSEGIKEQYIQDLDCKNIEVIESFPKHWNLEATKSTDIIKIIHHGNATVSRRIEDMIYTMDFLDSSYHLDLMLMPTDK
jgi:hypothetical protein